MAGRAIIFAGYCAVNGACEANLHHPSAGFIRLISLLRRTIRHPILDPEEVHMADAGPRPIVEIKPHAYDPFSRPEYFEGVLARRMIAFVIDLAIITIPI